MAKVSVIIPVYNVEKYISRCLESLANQTLKDLEIIIVNDGSTDNSRSIIEKYLKKHSLRIKYFEKQNGGLSSARNYGLKYATGEYIAFLDSDDYVEKDMYEDMYKIAKKDDADMVECDFLWEWENTELQWEKYKDKKCMNEIKKNKIEYKKVKKDTRRNYKNKRQMMKKPRVVAWNKLIKKKIIEKANIRFPEGLIYEDLDFFYKIIPYINKISYVNKYFVHYIQRENSISNSQSEKTADIFKIIDNIYKFYIEKGIYQEYKQELSYMRKRILFGSSLKRILKIQDKQLRSKLFWKTIKERAKRKRHKM